MAGFSRLASCTALTLISALPFEAATAQQSYALDDGSEVLVLDPIFVDSYEEEVLQSLGVSVISSDEIAERPVTNDISEIVRKMPGVNLTGASASGQRGNQRQIDIRGMGPENTLILIDGKPAQSRNSIRMGRGGERDTRGDSNWVAPELIESIEVIRGPAAARYGSGAAGGVVNIVTKQPEAERFTISTQYTAPESSSEGDTRRLNMIWSKPLTDALSLRLTANYNRTDADDPDINVEETCEIGTRGCNVYAGREGVENRDMTGLLRWEPTGGHRIDFELGYSRQGNIYAGDSQLSLPSELSQSLAEDGDETNVLHRRTFAVTHEGTYDFGESVSYLQLERTKNKRLIEGTAGSGEGRIQSEEYGVTYLDNIAAKTEWILPGRTFGRDTTYTFGTELRYEHLDDPVTVGSRGDLDFEFGDTEAAAENRDDEMDQTLLGIYAEANMKLSDVVTLSPSLRADYADTFGWNLSGAINAAWEVTPNWTAKVGIARAFKAPNLYQINPGYIYVTNGRGCPAPYYLQGPCYVLGNPDLEPETSTNTEIGVAYSGPTGVEATLTAFHNDYRDRIQSGTDQLATFTIGDDANRVFQWQNIPEAVVSGVEGSFAAPIGQDLQFATNFTYMARSENKETGDPLSLVPDYTINASLEWQATDALTLIPSLTHYGKIEAPKKNPVMETDYDNTDARDPYTLWNLASRYEVTEDFSLTAGITNVADKEIKRTGDGANTFNEPGRTYYVGLTKSF
ncbi:FepA family TonB-dependent siderophore receptor [Roseicyclus sp. F158]|uniref:FepA family TonB-dependent siderophore receptor n=1 Tax=Tropicimonas omnivorans TaxID=3075590 RepID=A0ABU3DHC1_9RHOB|nr:FepA family TonB-dependent siderophore receptor [Roseicyclus sp. F158]MDT0683120.1 FepA family TonB-dependent siderophore receptor [Roseicyclus sp. F158]